MSWKFELWDQPEYASGANRVAFVDAWSRATMNLSVDGNDTLQVTAPYDAQWLTQIRPRQVIKVTDELDRITEWRIIRVLDGRGSGDAITEIEAESLLSELSRPIVLRQNAGGSVEFAFNLYDVSASDIIDELIVPRLTAEGFGHFVKGTITPTQTLSFAFERYSSLELLTEMAGRLGAERWVERDDVAGNYKINIGTRGAGEPTVRTSFSRGNLQSYIRDRDSLTVSTVTIPAGKIVDGAANRESLGFAAWTVVSTTGSTVRLRDPNFLEDPIAYDDQLNGYYAIRPIDGAIIEVTDSSVVPQQVVLDTIPRGAEYVGSYVGATGAGTISMSYPTGLASGDVIIAGVAATDTSSVGAISAPTGWALATSYATGSGSNFGRLSVYHITRGGSNPTGTFTATGTTLSYRNDVVRNVAATGVIADAAATGVTGTGSLLSFATLTSTGTGTYQIGYRLLDGETFETYAKRMLKGPNSTIEQTFNLGSSVYGITANIGIAGTGYAFSVGEQVQFVASSSGSLAYSLSNPTGVSTYGRVIGTVNDDELRGERNWLRYGAFPDWTSQLVAPGFAVDPTPTFSLRRAKSSSLREIYSATVTNTVATGGLYEIEVSGLGTSQLVSHGDLLKEADGTLNSVVEGLGVNLFTGIQTMTVKNAIATGPIFIGGPDTNGVIYSNSHDLPAGSELLVDPSVRVKYFPGVETLWASVGFTAWASTTGIVTAPTGLLEVFVDTGEGRVTNDSNSFVWRPTTFVTGGSIATQEGVLRVRTSLTTESDVTMGVKLNTATGQPDYFTTIRWMQLHLGTDSQVPSVFGSHGNRIWTRGNQHLSVFGDVPTTYQVALIDLVRGQKEGLAIADDGIALGGTVRLVDSEIGELDLRIVELRLNANDPYDSTVTLANLPPRLAKIARRAKFAPPARPDPTPNTSKPADEVPPPPQPVIIAPDIGVTTPATIKLVGNIWSIYS